MTTVPPPSKNTAPSFPPPDSLGPSKKTKAEHRVEKKAIEILKNITDSTLSLALHCCDLRAASYAFIITLPFGALLGIIGGISWITKGILQAVWNAPIPITLNRSFEDWVQSSEDTWNKNEEKGWLDQETVSLFKQWRAELVEYTNAFSTEKEKLTNLFEQTKKENSSQIDKLNLQFKEKTKTLSEQLKSKDIKIEDYEKEINELREQTNEDLKKLKQEIKKKITDFKELKELESLFNEKILDVEQKYYKHRKEKTLEKEYKKYELENKDTPKLTLEEFKKNDFDQADEKCREKLTRYPETLSDPNRPLRNFQAEYYRGAKPHNYAEIVEKSLGKKFQ